MPVIGLQYITELGFDRAAIVPAEFVLVMSVIVTLAIVRLARAQIRPSQRVLARAAAWSLLSDSDHQEVLAEKVEGGSSNLERRE